MQSRTRSRTPRRAQRISLASEKEVDASSAMSDVIRCTVRGRSTATELNERMTRQQWVRRMCIYLILVRRAQDLQKQIEHGNNLEEAVRCISDIITISQRLGLCEGLAGGLAVAGVAVKGLALQGLAERLAEGLFSLVGLSEDLFGLEDIVVDGLAVEDIAVEDIAMEGPTTETNFDVTSSISTVVRSFLAGRDSVSELEQRFRQSHVGKEGHLLLLAKILREDIDQGNDREKAVKRFI